jgi:AcrR family transcriptional regulator
MATNIKTQFSKAKQSRSQKTLDDLLEAADELVSNADPKKFTTRSLADKSGYALGTLTTRLQSVENVFLYVIEKQRDKNIQSLVKSIKDFDEKNSIEELAELIFDQARELITKVNPKVIQFIESRFIKKDQFSSKYFHYVDPIAHALVKSQKTNTSNTFRKVTEKEAQLLIRSFIMIMERPFVEEDSIAGTKEHRRISIKSFVRLFVN